MTTTAKIHNDGRGLTFVTEHGYTAYRFRGLKGRGRHEVALITERHQRRGTTRTAWMPLRRWESLVDQAHELARPEAA